MTMNKIYSIFALLMMWACNPMHDIYEELDKAETPVSEEIEYTLSDADYKKVSDLAYALKTAEDSVAAKFIKDKKAFSDAVKVADYLPALFPSLYPGLKGGSSVMATYNYYEGAFPQVKKVVATVEDYKRAGGETALHYSIKKPNADKEPDAKMLAKLLGEEPADGDMVLLTYNVTSGFDGKTENVYDLKMGKYDYQILLDTVKKLNKKLVNGNSEYMFGASVDNRNFNGRASNWEDQYKEVDDFKDIAVTEDYMAVQIKAGVKLFLEIKFSQKAVAKQAVKDVIYHVHYDVYYSRNIPKSAAFVCTKGGEKPEFEEVTEGVSSDAYEVTRLYVYNAKYKELALPAATVAYQLTEADYKEMGFKYAEFASGISAADYLPVLLSRVYPYAQNKSERVVVYLSEQNNSFAWKTDRYILKDGVWSSYDPVVARTDQFVYATDKWIFDPSVRRTMGKEDYDILVQWVNENKNGYFDAKYKNAEYWFGASTYKDNFDIRLTSRKPNDPDGLLAGKTDDEINKILQDQIQKGIVLLLETVYPDAVPQKDGMDMYYKVTYLTYDGNNHNYMVTYKCVDTGKFELSEGPVEL